MFYWLIKKLRFQIPSEAGLNNYDYNERVHSHINGHDLTFRIVLKELFFYPLL
jgi:hypothetical protein